MSGPNKLRATTTLTPTAGATVVVMPNAVWMERVCALVSPPRKHLVAYYGAPAPASGPRPKVVPGQTAAVRTRRQALRLAAATVRAVVGQRGCRDDQRGDPRGCGSPFKSCLQKGGASSTLYDVLAHGMHIAARGSP